MNIPPLFANPVVRVVTLCVITGAFVLSISMPIFRVVFAVAMGLVWCMLGLMMVQHMKSEAQTIAWRAVLKRPFPYLFLVFISIQFVILIRFA